MPHWRTNLRKFYFCINESIWSRLKNHWALLVAEPQLQISYRPNSTRFKKIFNFLSSGTGASIIPNVGLSVCQSVCRSKEKNFYSSQEPPGGGGPQAPSLLKGPKSHRGGGQEEEGSTLSILESTQASSTRRKQRRGPVGRESPDGHFKHLLCI